MGELEPSHITQRSAPTIRLANEADADAIASIYAPFCTSSIVSFEEAAPSSDEMVGRMRKSAPFFPWLVLEDNGAIAGYVYASAHRERAAYRWSVDVTVYVHSEFRRRGVGSGLYESLFRVLNAQGYCRAFAGVALPNPGSEALHESVGFVEVGVYREVGWKLGRWCDVRWYQRSLAEGQPGKILPVEAIRSTASWQEAMQAGLRRYRTEAASS